MNSPWRFIWLMVLGAIAFFGAAVVTLRAAEQATRTDKAAAISTSAAPTVATPAAHAYAPPAAAAPQSAPPSHPPPSAPEESATIKDDPTVAPDPAESADNNVSFPADI